MDYVPGGVAALITGNVTPNRPRLTKRALTPTKHQPSPNVTPKSELVDNRSIFLSPSLQKKKAIVKKSPKRIFQNPGLDVTIIVNSATISPKAEKVKKHLEDELETDTSKSKNTFASSPKTKSDADKNIQDSNEDTPKKKKQKYVSKILNDNALDECKAQNKSTNDVENLNKSPKKKKKGSNSKIENSDKSQYSVTEKLELNNVNTNAHESSNQQIAHDVDNNKILKKNKNKEKINLLKLKINKKGKSQDINAPDSENQINDKENQNNNFSVLANSKKVKNKKHNYKQNTENKQIKHTHKNKGTMDSVVMGTNVTQESEEGTNSNHRIKKKSKKKGKVNPNAITHLDSASEHESDNEIKSENEEINSKVLSKESADYTSDEEEEEEETPKKLEKKETEKKETDPEEVKRTLFVGNVPFSKKCKKEIKRIFNKYGEIETVRIRTVPVKDARDTPKLAVIKNELHPERSTVNVYVKFASADSVEQALVENNTVLNEYHLRVSRSESTGAEHDPKCSVFVGNLPFALENEALRAKFQGCGEIESIRIIRDKKTNAGKGFGYVNFKSKDGVELALALSEEDLTIKNRILRVKRCTQNPQKRGGNRFNKGGNQFNKSGSQFNKSGNQFNRGGNQFNKGGNQFNKGGNRFNQREDRSQGRFQENERQVGFNRQNRNEPDGAYKRIMNKRKNQENFGEGPPNKRQNTNQPRKEKKEKQDFVGVTAEKKKKHKFDKGQKKKKMFSEILTK